MGQLDTLVALSQRADTADDERADINAELFRTYLSTLTRGDFLNPEEIAEWRREVETTPEFAKSKILDQRWYPFNRQLEHRKTRRVSALFISELGLYEGQGAERWAEKPSVSGHSFLMGVARQLEPAVAIIRTRTRQVCSFMQPYRENSDNPLGFRWIRTDGERMGPDDLKATRRLDAILMSCGTESDPIERAWVDHRRDLPGFISGLVQDTLSCDACPTEVEPTMRGTGIAGWYGIDPQTVKLAFEDGYEGDDSIVGVQVNPENQQPLVGYEKHDLIYAVRNPRTMVRYMGYGQAELEDFIRAGTAYLNTFTWNSSQTDRNAMPRGFLTLFGRYDKRELYSFKEQWHALMRGASRRWTLPVLTAKDRQTGGALYTPVDTQTHEMLGTKWLVFLTSILCAYYGADPTEINLESFTSRTSSLSGNDTSERLQSGHDKGLIPLALWVQTWLNTHIVRRLTKKYELTLVGLFPQDEERKHERQKLALTVNEVRAIDGEEEHPIPLVGDAPVNPSLMSAYTFAVQQQMAQQQPGGMPAPGGAAGREAGGGYLPNSEAPTPYARGDESQAGAGGNGGPPTPGGGMPGGPPPGPFGAPGAPGAPMAKASHGRLVVEIRERPNEAWGDA